METKVTRLGRSGYTRPPSVGGDTMGGLGIIITTDNKRESGAWWAQTGPGGPMKFLAALVFTAGLSLAGSDGSLFPWPNLAGVALFACMIPLAKIIQGGKI
jgi:hypothetical protein